MNSALLQQEFKHIYEKFFVDHQIVVSLPYGINRVGNPHPQYTGISIKQKIPLRIYFGATKSKIKTKQQITIGTITYYDLNDNIFIEKKLSTHLPYGETLESDLNAKIKQLFDCDGNYELNILCELPRGVGLGFDQIIITGLIALLFRFFGGLTNKECETRKNQEINDIINNTLNQSYKIYLATIQILNNIPGSGQQNDYVANSLYYGSYPTISFPSDKKNRNEIGKLYAYRLNDLVGGLTKNPYIPLDYGIIYSGKPILHEQIIGYLQTNEQYKGKLIKLYNEWFHKDMDLENSNDKPFFYKYFVEQNIKFGGILDYITSLGSISMELLYSFYKIYKKGFDDNDIKYFIQTINKIRYGLNINKQPSVYLQDLIGLLYNEFGGKWVELGVNYIDSNISGGSLLFISPFESYRYAFARAQKKMLEEGIGSRIIYTSRVDGVEQNGLVFEQDIDHAIYSKYVKNSSFQLVFQNSNSVVGGYEELLKIKCKILFDKIAMKIYIDGVQLSSKQIPSQSACIEIITYLMDHIGENIDSKQLPSSSYTKAKNDMQGKVIGPFQQTLMALLGEKLPISITGSGSQFVIKLDSSSIDIGILQQIENNR